MKGMNIIQLNTLHLNVVLLNGDEMPGEVVVGGGEVVPVPPTEPETPDVPVEPKKFILSASVANGVVSATLNGVVVSLPYTANEGDVIVLEVTPNDGYAFEGWADGNTDNPRTITMNADVALSAECSEVVQPPVGNYIQFEDAEVERILMAHGVSSDGIGITKEDAAAITSIVTTFKGNTEITSFNELRYFTGVTTLSNGAFKNCSALKTIDLSHIKRVGSNTVWNNGPFFGCSSLESVNMPIAVEIANYSFNKCSLLKSAQMPNAEIIGANAFEYTILEGVIDIPNAKTISASAFRGTNITELLAPSAQKFDGAWDTGVCQGCKYLVKVDVGVASSLGERTFEGCKALETFIIRATTPPSLNGNLLSNTNSTFLIYVPDASLEAYKTAVNWNQYADRIHPLSEIEGSPYIQFADAEVERVLMSKGVSSDGVGITKEDAAAVTSIATWFLNNTTITSFNELKYFTSLTEVSPKNDGGYGASAFRGASSLREVTIPASVTRIGSQCFGKCTSLEKVTFEANGNIREINANAFSECSALSIEVDFPALQILGANAFGKCAKLTKVKSLGSVAELYGSATTGMTQGEFYGCASASEITLPSSLTLIGINCFRNCYALERIICRATTPPSLANVSAFTNTNNCPIYVPDASLEAYKTATNWSSYASRIKGISEYNG